MGIEGIFLSTKFSLDEKNLYVHLEYQKNTLLLATRESQVPRDNSN